MKKRRALAKLSLTESCINVSDHTTVFEVERTGKSVKDLL